ncbi:GyrI-like domain-containing protein [Microbacterium halotolerans]|uniref:GyrI-like domain-containing protein n=1 Tax=Microbacterium halotolerans TaxID=246613 RepID=UPI0013C2A7DF|nr:GyrI-like domain-containing protein [Microbacterium halotolerans]
MTIIPRSFHTEPFTVLGIEVRTNGAASAVDIPAHWNHVVTDDALAHVPGRLTDEVYAVYTNLEHAGRSRSGWFSFIIGVAVDPATSIPDGMTLASVPASERLEFAAPDGDHSRILDAWQAAWDYDDAQKTFLCEYEKYGVDGTVSVNLGVS